MHDISKIIKEKNYVISEFLIKNINKDNINLYDFLLLIYFINISDKFEMQDIKKHLGINEEQILNSYDSLTKKGYIELKVNKIDGKIEEKVSLDNFYNKIILSRNDEESNNNDIYYQFENAFGRTLSTIEYELIENWIKNGISEEQILRALREAVLNGVSNMKYIDKILFEWNKKKVSSSIVEEDKKEIFGYDWLNDK
jgi:DNA replication protein